MTKQKHIYHTTLTNELVASANDRYKNPKKYELEQNLPDKLKTIRGVITPISEKSFVTKHLHGLTHQAEFVEFIFASLSISYDPEVTIPIVRNILLMSSIASILGIIAGSIEWYQLRVRIKLVEEYRKNLEELIIELAAYQTSRASPNNIQSDLLQHSMFLAYWEGRLQRCELDLSRLKTERWVARAGFVSSIAALALVIIIGIDIELILLSLIFIDKAVHAYFARLKTQQVDREKIPLCHINLQEDEKKLYQQYFDFDEKVAEVMDRPNKRLGKQFIRYIEAACALTALVTACCPHLFLVNILAIKVLIITTLSVDGATKLFWALYQKFRKDNKKKLEKIYKEQREDEFKNDESPLSVEDNDNQPQSLTKQLTHWSIFPCIPRSQEKNVGADGYFCDCLNQPKAYS